MSKVDIYVNGNKNIGESAHICYNKVGNKLATENQRAIIIYATEMK